MGFIRELARLTRFEHALMLAFAVFIAESIALGHLPPYDLLLLLSLLVPIFSEMGSFALNDYLDIETDRLNKKTDRPLVKGTIALSFALYFSIACLVLSVASAYPINSYALAIAVVFNILAIAYNWKLKDLPLVGNIYIALTMAIPFLFGNFVVSSSFSLPVLALAVLGFVAGLGREIIKSVQDMEGDVRARGSKTLPVLIGKRPALLVASFLYLLFIPISLAPFWLGLEMKPLAVGGVVAADILLLAICYKILVSPENSYRFARNASLVSFVLGMLGIFVAVL